jgi:ABC-type spermidine/putrescine transport system permease subunit II
VWPRWLADALRGKPSLARAFWVYGVGISVFYSLIGLLIDTQNLVVATVYVLFGIALGVLQTIVLWRCAYNSRSRFLGRLVRTAMVSSLILLAIVLCVLFIDSDLLLPRSNQWKAP